MIKKIKAGWGCTGVLLSEKEIPAGSEGEIKVTLKTGRRKGKIRKSVYVYTNDPTSEKVKLTVSANIIAQSGQYNNPFSNIHDICYKLNSLKSLDKKRSPRSAIPMPLF